MPSRTVHLTLAELPGIHAMRAVYTAFAAVPGVERAEVTRAGATVEHDGTVTRAMIDEALALVGGKIVEWREERGLPVIDG